MINNVLKKLIICLMLLNIQYGYGIKTNIKHVSPGVDKMYANPKERRSLDPFLGGDTFRAIAQFQVDETRSDFDTDSVKIGDIIFVQSNYLHDFFNSIHPYIKSPYILISHNQTRSIPGQFERYLNDKKIIAWFAKNAVGKHPKLFGIPLGIANQSPTISRERIKILEDVMKKPIKKDKLLCMNFRIDTKKDERSYLYNLFVNKPFCYNKVRGWADRLGFEEYLTDLKRSKFVLSPAGLGIDCYRTWETGLICQDGRDGGCYAIVKRSPIVGLYNKLPVVIVDRWEEVTQEFLEKKYVELEEKRKNGFFDYNRLYADYWINPILELQRTVKSGLVKIF